MSDPQRGPDGPNSAEKGSTVDQEVARCVEVMHWVKVLRDAGLKGRSVAFALGVAPHTVRRWETGTSTPSSESLAALRLLVIAWKLAPTLTRRLSMLTAQEFADELNGIRIRALVAWEADRSVPRPADSASGVRHG